MSTLQIIIIVVLSISLTLVFCKSLYDWVTKIKEKNKEKNKPKVENLVEDTNIKKEDN